MREREPKVAEKVLVLRKAVLWLFALIFLGYSLRPAWYWVQDVWREMNNAAPRWADWGAWAVKAVGPLALAICLIVFLWKTLGSPFSPPREKSPEASPGDEPRVRDLPPRWKNFESRAEVERQAERLDEKLKTWRGVLWAVLLPFLLGASGWALLSVACASEGPSEWSIFDGDSASAILAEGFVPLAVILFLALLLWWVLGPPFTRHRSD